MSMALEWYRPFWLSSQKVIVISYVRVLLDVRSILRDLIIFIIFGEKFLIVGFSIHLPVTTSHLGPDTNLIILFLKPLDMRLLLMLGTTLQTFTKPTGKI